MNARLISRPEDDVVRATRFVALFFDAPSHESARAIAAEYCSPEVVVRAGGAGAVASGIPDAAGLLFAYREAAGARGIRATDAVLVGGHVVAFLTLPDAEDPPSVAAWVSLKVTGGRIDEIRGPFRANRPPFSLDGVPYAISLASGRSAENSEMAGPLRADYLSGLGDLDPCSGGLWLQYGLVSFTLERRADSPVVFSVGAIALWAAEVVEPDRLERLATKGARSLLGGLIGAALTQGDLGGAAIGALIGYGSDRDKHRGLALGLPSSDGDLVAAFFRLGTRDAESFYSSLQGVRSALGLPLLKSIDRAVSESERQEEQREPGPALQEGSGDPFDQLRRLYSLYVEGIISEAEYETKKAEILRRL